MKKYAKIIDIEAFRKRVEEVHGAGYEPELSDFLEAWHRSEQELRG